MTRLAAATCAACLLDAARALSLPLAQWSRLAAPAPAARQDLHVKIDGVWYDVTDWAARHPGGAYRLEWVNGFDVSGLFHTIHLFSRKKTTQLLRGIPTIDESELPRSPTVTPQHLAGAPRHAPLELPEIRRVPLPLQDPIFEDWLLRREVPTYPSEVQSAARVDAASPGTQLQTLGARYDADTALKRDLEELLHSRFGSPAEYKATPEHWARIVGALALTLSCMAGWLDGSVGATLLLPWSQWLLFSPTCHESSHSTLSTRPWVNQAAMFAAMPFIFNPFVWFTQHLVSHHQYPNDEHLDVDLHHLRPARLHPDSARDPGASGYHFLFKGFFTTAGMSVLWPVRALIERPTARFYNLVTPIPSAVSKRTLALSLLPVAFANLYPWWLVATGEADVCLGFFLWLYPWVGSSAIWTVMTQVSHAQEDAQQSRGTALDANGLRWQIESAVDYSVDTPLVAKLTASLNLQSMHHALPSVCGCHFHGLYAEYAAICERHGVKLNVRRDLDEAWGTCVDRVFELSSAEGSPPPSAIERSVLAYLAAPAVAFAPVLCGSYWLQTWA